MTDIQTLLKGAIRFADRNSPTILTGFAVGGVFTTAVLAAKAAPKVVAEIGTIEQQRYDDGIEPVYLTKREICKVAWRPYAPAFLMGGATIAAIIGANTISTKRHSALVAAASLTERAYHEYKEKALEQLGEAKEEKIRAAVAQDRFDKDEVGSREVIVVGDGEQLCYDTLSGRSFMSDIENIRRAENDINAMINNDMYASVNDFYRKIGLATTTMGEELGWNNDNMLSVAFSGILSGGKPCIAIDYHQAPVANYHKIW